MVASAQYARSSCCRNSTRYVACCELTRRSRRYGARVRGLCGSVFTCALFTLCTLHFVHSSSLHAPYIRTSLNTNCVLLAFVPRLLLPPPLTLLLCSWGLVLDHESWRPSIRCPFFINILAIHTFDRISSIRTSHHRRRPPGIRLCRPLFVNS